GRGGAGADRDSRRRQRARRAPGPARPQAPGDRPRAGHRAAVAAARRGGRRPHRPRGHRLGGDRPGHQRRRRRGHLDRARGARADLAGGPDDLPVRRGVHRRRHPGRGLRQPPGARGLPRQRRHRHLDGPGRDRRGRRAMSTRQESGSPLLEVRDLVVHHGQLRALSGISLAVYPGEVYALIGANGAGKSTLLRTISGLHNPTSGAITYDGKNVTGLRPDKRAAAGIVMVPEGRRLFPSLTLEENLKVGMSFARKGPWNIARIYELFPWMKERRGQKTAQMSGGEQQSVAIGRALVANPRVLLLDELSLGLAPVIVQRIYATLPQVLESGITVLLV